MGVLRIEQAGVEAGLVAEEEKALGVGIESAQGINVFGEAKFGEGAVGGAIGSKLGKNSVRFMEGEEHGRKKGSGAIVLGKVGGSNRVVAPPVF